MYEQISYWAFEDGLTGQRNVPEAINLAAKVGFAGIELAVSPGGDLTPRTSARKCKQLAAVAKDAGVKIGSVATGMLWDTNPASASARVRTRALKLAKESLRVTSELGAKHLLVLTGHVDVFFMPDAEVVPYDDCYKRSVAFGRAVAREASRLGVTACFENVWNRFLAGPLEWKRFLNDVGAKGSGMYFDVANAWNFGYPQHWIKILGRKIKRVHVKGFKRTVGTVDGFCQIGDGDVPLLESIKLLAKMAGRVLAVVAHPDDIEFMMAGTMLLLARAGQELHYMTLANGSCGTVSHSKEEIVRIRTAESAEAAARLGAVYHPPLVDDLMIYYEPSLVARAAAIYREIDPEILLLQAPQDYMADHINASRVMVTAAFCRSMRNFDTDPPTEPLDGNVALYHAVPMGMADQLRRPVEADFYVDVGSVLGEKREALACHRSQKEWLDRSQGLDSYLNAMQDMTAQMGLLSTVYRYAEGWRRHLHVGYAPADFDPLCVTLREHITEQL